VLAGGLALAGALVAGRPGGALARADRQFGVRLRAVREVARALPALRPPVAQRCRTHQRGIATEPVGPDSLWLS
jgi:hypothetical protein